MSPSTPQPPISHDEAWELLPWLATDRLTSAQLRGVLHHLERSPALRQELRYLSELERTVTHPMVDAGLRADTRAHLSAARVLEKIDRLSPAARPPRNGALHRLWQRLEAATRSPLVVFQAAAIAVLLFLVITPGRGVLPSAEAPTPATYRTLTGTTSQVGTFESSPETTTAAESTRLRLVVEAELSLADLGSLLDSVDATLVGFSTGRLPAASRSHLILTLALAPGSDTEASLDALRSVPSVALAERAHGAL